MTGDNKQAEYGLVVSFPDQSATFVHGFEAGGIWEQMRRGDVSEIEKMTHIENREVIQRMATAEGWSVEIVGVSTPGWDFTKLVKAGAAPKRPNPHGLRAVK
jgi:hypothetical protein